MEETENLIETETETENETVPETVPETETETETEDVTKVLNESWQARLTAVSNKYENAIAERDKIIQQLIVNNQETNNDTNLTDSIVEKINRQRNFKKW